MKFQPTTPRKLIAAAILSAIATVALAQVPSLGGTWETLAPMPDRRTEVSVASDGERVYVLGGFERTNAGATAPLAVHAYDPASNSWSTPTDRCRPGSTTPASPISTARSTSSAVSVRQPSAPPTAS